MSTLDAAASALLPRCVRSTRCKLGLSRDDFARECGVSECTVARWERGDVEPKVSAILASRLLRMPFVEELVGRVKGDLWRAAA